MRMLRPQRSPTSLFSCLLLQVPVPRRCNRRRLSLVVAAGLPVGLPGSLLQGFEVGSGGGKDLLRAPHRLHCRRDWSGGVVVGVLDLGWLGVGGDVGDFGLDEFVEPGALRVGGAFGVGDEVCCQAGVFLPQGGVEGADDAGCLPGQVEAQVRIRGGELVGVFGDQVVEDVPGQGGGGSAQGEGLPDLCGPVGSCVQFGRVLDRGRVRVWGG